MRRPHLFVAIGAFVVVLAVAEGIRRPAETAATTGPRRPRRQARRNPQLSHRPFALLYLGAIVHKSRVSILKKWPSPPYQQFTSGPQTCYEWWDKPVALYNLCFQNGLLTTKAIE